MHDNYERLTEAIDAHEEKIIAPVSVGSARRIRAAAEGPELAAVPTARTMSFGSFRLIPARRLLLDGETPVRLGSRALEILIALAERPGALVRKDELLARAWPGMHVIEGNLKFQ